MKTLFLVFLSLTISVGISQDASKLFQALGNSDSSIFMSRFTNDVEICIGTDQDFYSKKDAKTKLDEFLSSVNPKSCKALHNGSSKDNKTKYSVGELNTAKGKYRVFIYFEGNQVAGLVFDRE